MAAETPRPPRGYANVLLNGVWVERLKVQPAPHNGKCLRSGALFQRGAVIGYKDRDALTPGQARAVFGDKPPKHITVLLTPEEIDPPPLPPVVLPEPAEVVGCAPDPVLLEPFRDLMEASEYVRDPSDEWGMGNLSTRAVRYSCGCLTREDRPLAHRHDPAELALCTRVATEAADRLANFTAGEGARIWPFFAAAVVGKPVPDALDEALVRRAFGGTIAPGLNFSVALLERRGGHWNNLESAHLGLDHVPSEVHERGDIEAYLQAAWDGFAEWFVGVPGLRLRSTVGVGYSDGDPGPLKPRFLLALTAAGSLVGVTTYEVQA